MKKLELNQMENLQGGKMFDYDQKCGPCRYGSQVCNTTYTIFWINFSSTDSMPCES
jgi:hypothetical protein